MDSIPDIEVQPEVGQQIFIHCGLTEPGTLMLAHVTSVILLGDEWMNVQIDCKRYRVGTMAQLDEEGANWSPSSGPSTVLLYRRINQIHDGMVETMRTPQGTTARFSLATTLAHV